MLDNRTFVTNICYKCMLQMLDNRTYVTKKKVNKLFCLTCTLFLASQNEKPLQKSVIDIGNIELKCKNARTPNTKYKNIKICKKETQKHKITKCKIQKYNNRKHTTTQKYKYWSLMLENSKKNDLRMLALNLLIFQNISIGQFDESVSCYYIFFGNFVAIAADFLIYFNSMQVSFLGKAAESLDFPDEEADLVV